MAKVHPSATASSRPSLPALPASSAEAASLTVWRKSLVFHGDGFTVFDAKGNLAFRVENYPSASRAEIVLMDADGKPLLTIRRKKLSLGDHWLIYDGEAATNPQFAVKKHVNLIGSRSLVHVTACCPGAAKSCLSYEVEGSYSRRCCTVYDHRRRQLAQIMRKEASPGVALGADVFRLIVEPGLDAAFAMAVVILLDQMFESRGSILRV
ncbi:protein LURP-one-related 8-like [Zingiber officinale]|uniref:Protein LURP-one-related 8 n=1 Tax=Zingiber officinale TaxID=94328 RepID=A0A8J5FD92_ZINOF|nr:protein LURP-one-related 8-like [Zingiber officinale]KAG6487439.1 hypothetical protein ZIOFF_056025 [Zingiber officinale]